LNQPGKTKMALLLALLGHDIIKYRFLIFARESKEAHLAEMALPNMTIFFNYKLEEEP